MKDKYAYLLYLLAAVMHLQAVTLNPQHILLAWAFTLGIALVDNVVGMWRTLNQDAVA